MASKNTPIEFMSPVGRLVQGDCFKPNTTDQQGRPLVIKTGANAGQPREEYFTALAIAKNDPGLPEFFGKLTEAARVGFPNLFDAAGNCLHPSFSFKFVDGDSVQMDEGGKRPCDKTGFPGNFVFRFSSGFAPGIYGLGGKSKITDPEMVKRGYYVRVAGTVVDNENAQKPGIYLNTGDIELVGHGEVIQSGPDHSAAFAAAPAVLPPGATPAPAVSASPFAGAPGTPPAAAPPVAAPPVAAPPVAVPGGIQPVPGFAAGPPAPAAAPAPAPAPVTPSALPAKLYTLPDGKQYTLEQLNAGGWTREQIVALGQ